MDKSTISITVDERLAGTRLDRFISENARVGSRSVAEKMIEKGFVEVNGVPKPKSHKIAANDHISFTLLPKEEVKIAPQEMEFKIFYEDKDLAVVSKPAGVVVHPSHGHTDGTLVHGLLAHFDSLSGDGERPGIVHRLDKDTSGLMIIAKNDNSHKILSDELKARNVKRTYKALVLGDLRQGGKIDMPVGRHAKNRKKMSVTPSGREAVTYFEVEKRFVDATLVNVNLETGRTHQIRVHMNYIKHPVAGDPVYGGKGKLSEHLGLKRQFLHSIKLSFNHPVTGENLMFEDDLPEDLRSALNILGGMGLTL